MPKNKYRYVTTDISTKNFTARVSKRNMSSGFGSWKTYFFYVTSTKNKNRLHDLQNTTQKVRLKIKYVSFFKLSVFIQGISFEPRRIFLIPL